MRILLIGPTAVGKTETSLFLAEELGTAIISADSRQCYKYLNIGTATPEEGELQRVPHYNISILEPDAADSAADFNDRAVQWEQELRSPGKPALFVGGSTLHLQSLIVPFDDIPASDAKNQRELEERIESEGLESLYRQLQEVDRDYAQRMDGLNRQRIIRALDVWMQTGRPFSSFHTNWATFTLPEDTFVFGLHRPRKKLYARINRRVEMMLEQGLENETRAVLDRGFDPDAQSLQTVGYRQVIDFFNGRIDREQMIFDIKAKTRQYAKRQLTWFRRWPFIEWIDVDGRDPRETAENILQRLAAKWNKD